MSADLLSRLEAYANCDPALPYWLCGGNSEPSYTYCFACAEKAAAEYPGAEIEGGWVGETDGCLHCQTCGCLLEYTLTDNGVYAELDHFRKVRFRRPLSREEAYHVARMLAGANDDARVIAVARRATRQIPDVPARSNQETE